MENGVIGLVLIYIILSSLLTWIIISTKRKYVLKFFIIALVMWCAIGLHNLLPDLQGWPTCEDIPDGSKIISIRIIEPNKGDLGAFYFWCNTKPEWRADAINILNPFKLFIYTGLEKPRAYQLPYDKELHKRITEAQKGKKRVGGSWMQIKKTKKVKGRSSGDRESESELIEFIIVNPIEVLKK